MLLVHHIRLALASITSRSCSRFALACITSSATKNHCQKWNLYLEPHTGTRTPFRLALAFCHIKCKQSALSEVGSAPTLPYKDIFKACICFCHITPNKKKHCQKWDLNPRPHTRTSSRLAFASPTSHKKTLSEVGFEPTPTYVDQNLSLAP